MVQKRISEYAIKLSKPIGILYLFLSVFFFEWFLGIPSKIEENSIIFYVNIAGGVSYLALSIFTFFRKKGSFVLFFIINLFFIIYFSTYPFEVLTIAFSFFPFSLLFIFHWEVDYGMKWKFLEKPSQDSAFPS